MYSTAFGCASAKTRCRAFIFTMLLLKPLRLLQWLCSPIVPTALSLSIDDLTVSSAGAAYLFVRLLLRDIPGKVAWIGSGQNEMALVLR